MELVTLHAHTGYSGHGSGSVRALAEAACTAAITVLGVTEHYPLSPAFDHDAYLSMPWESIGPYLDDIEQAQALFPDMQILAGCEFDWLGDDEDRSLAPDAFSAFDIVLGSVHFVDGWAFDDPSQVEAWEERGVDYVWRRYFSLWCDAVSSDLPFDVMAHPDIVKKFNYRPSFDPLPLYKQAAEAAAAAGRMVEVNTAGLQYPCKEMYPGQDLLREFARAGVPCTIGTDAHEPRFVARDIEKGYRWMHEAGYREVTVPLKDGDLKTVALE